jgi:hypothetical protein
MTCALCSLGHHQLDGRHYSTAGANWRKDLGPCTDYVPPAPPAEKAAKARASLSEVTSRIRAFGPKKAGQGFTERSQPAEREPGEDDGDE